jgi:predicted membrane GTPase involved in stress response
MQDNRSRAVKTPGEMGLFSWRAKEVKEDELVEVTAKSIRLRKKILDQNKRPKSRKKSD